MLSSQCSARIHAPVARPAAAHSRSRTVCPASLLPCQVPLVSCSLIDRSAAAVLVRTAPALRIRVDSVLKNSSVHSGVTCSHIPTSSTTSLDKGASFGYTHSLHITANGALSFEQRIDLLMLKLKGESSFDSRQAFYSGKG